MRPAELDPVDRAIIAELQRDGRTPYSKLGPAVGLSQAAVRQRVQRLVESGVMQVVAVTDPTVLGIGVQAMIGLNATCDLRAIAELVAARDDCDYVVVVAGRFDVLVEVVAADTDALLDLVNDGLRSIPGVTGAEVLTYLSLIKQTYSWGARA